MSTEPTPSPDAQPTTDAPPTDVAARGREDPWAADDETPEATDGGALPSARAQRQFDPYSVARLRNLVDDENAYCS